METTATYDKESKEFIVHTPTPLAQKYWITNGACHAHHIIVFSQLYIDGVNQGNDFDDTFNIFCSLHTMFSYCSQLSFLPLPVSI